MTTRRKKTKEVVEEVEDLDEDLELEELEEAVEEETKPKKARAKRADAPAFGIQELCALIEQETGKAHSPREVRTLLRKMARDNSGRINREITPDNRSRYSWSGEDDPEVQAVIAAITGGELEAEKKAALDALKNRKAAGGKKAPAKKKAAAKKTPPPADEEEEDDDLEEDDEE